MITLHYTAFYKVCDCTEDNVVYCFLIEASPAQEADQSSVSPRLRGGEEEEEDFGEKGSQATNNLNNYSYN